MSGLRPPAVRSKVATVTGRLKRRGPALLSRFVHGRFTQFVAISLRRFPRRTPLALATNAFRNGRYRGKISVIHAPSLVSLSGEVPCDCLTVPAGTPSVVLPALRGRFFRLAESPIWRKPCRKAIRIMAESRWPQRLPLAAFITPRSRLGVPLV